jgi:prenyltransferase beta subunit
MNLITHINEAESAEERTAFKTLVERLRCVTEIEPSPALSARIMNALDSESKVCRKAPRKNRAFDLKPWYGIAAVVMAVLTLLIFSDSLLKQMRRSGCSVSAHAQWLADNQESDGSWNPARHGGSELYQPALTALAMLALHKSGDTFNYEVLRARRYLKEIQNPNGSFGIGRGRERFYNQAMVTYALAMTGAGDHNAAVLERAVTLIKRDQSAAGGWDYTAGSEGNSAITAWQIQALAAAEKVGVRGTHAPVKKGLRWLRGMTDSNGGVSYKRGSSTLSDTVNALTAYTLLTAGEAFPELSSTGQRIAASLELVSSDKVSADLYRDSMKVRAFKAAGANDAAELLKNRIVKSGIAPYQDQWSKIGGRLYFESLNSLTATF